MNILLVGSGGREHALAWKISQSPLLTRSSTAPRGTRARRPWPKTSPLADSDIAGLAAFAAERGIDLTVVGPEVPLTLGIVDEFERRNLRIFGPSKKAAELEGSKVFAKQFMDRHRIPTARFKVAESPSQAFRILKSGEFSYPLVIKADGLAAGKGVIICPGQRQAEEAVECDHGEHAVRCGRQARPDRGTPQGEGAVLHRDLRRGQDAAPGDDDGPQGRL